MSDTEAQPTRCLRCGRLLRVSKIYGPVCRARIRAAQMAQILKGFTAAQIEAARELVADGALVALGHHNAYRVVSSDGSTVYTATAKGCNCPNWLRRVMPKPCKHNAAVMILDAAKGI